MRRVTLLVVIVILFLIGLVAVDLLFFNASSYPHQVEEQMEREDNDDLQKAETLLERGQAEEALDIIALYLPHMESGHPDSMRWKELLLIASGETRDLHQLLTLYDDEPILFDTSEKASLLVAESFIANGDLDNYRFLRDLWKRREANAEAWMLLDSDRLLLEGKVKEANALLGSRPFAGKTDIERLMRLALINANENPKAAWRYLSEAQGKDPENTEIRFYKAKLLESVGKNNFAAKEYETAAAMDPSNIYLQDQLAEFYLRKGQHEKAMDLWVENLPTPTLDTIWVKTYFWNRMLIPADVDWKAYPLPKGKLAPLVQYLTELHTGVFWDKTAFSRLPNRDYFLETQQVTFWMRLVDALKMGHEPEALGLLQNNTFASSSWNHELEYVLKQILTYRKKGRLDQRLSPVGLQLDDSSSHEFFRELEVYATNAEVDVPDDLHELMLSKEAFSAAFIAAGWLEAGLELHSLHILPKHFPDFVALGLTRALRKNRSDIDALDFASVQADSKRLRLEMGEMYVTGGNSEAALKLLEPLAKDYSDTGAKAAHLASLVYLDRGDLDTARDIVNRQPRLAHDVRGKEVLAKVSLLKGDEVKAEEIYSSIQQRSTEAMSWLAKKFYKEQNWDRAKDLTQSLLKIYPNNQQLQQNLKRIIQEQQKRGLN